MLPPKDRDKGARGSVEEYADNHFVGESQLWYFGRREGGRAAWERIVQAYEQ